jgi:hypothetical protein
MPMTLKQLVEFRERLKVELSTAGIEQEVNALCFHLSKLDHNLDPEYKQFLDETIAHYKSVIEHTNANNQRIKETREQLEKDIATVAAKFFVSNYDIETSIDQNTNVRFGRQLTMTPEVYDVVKQRIELYMDWKYPGLEIGLQNQELTKLMVALDPFYLVDPNQVLIQDTLDSFTPEYQQRLRTYHVNSIDLSCLPQGQIGFALCWNYLNYKSLDTIKLWLMEVFKVLRPGGTFMFSYNNADTASGAGLAESMWMSYMPKSILIPLCEMVGFEIAHEFDFETSASWLEVKKPGQLETIKAHQVLGRIKYKNSP